EIELKLDGDGTSVKARFGEPLRVVALGGDDKGAADARPVVDAAPTTPADAAPIAPDIAIRPDRAIKRDSRLRRDARRPVARKAYGTLDIFCVPWAHVEIDGKPIGKYTPVKNLRLRVGRHVVKLSNNAIDKSRTVRVRIRKNKTSTINVTLGR
ncbi:MAG: PEGA domain-containing protein, partial [Myxococcales bacterium]|nr:PEGA domain-containing protein [Myxococcales bacterium]